MRQEARRPAAGHRAAPCPSSVQAQPRQTPAGSLQILTSSRSLGGQGLSANTTSRSLHCCCQSSVFAWQGQGTRSCLPAQIQGPARALPGTSRPRNTVLRACASGAFRVWFQAEEWSAGGPDGGHRWVGHTAPELPGLRSPPRGKAPGLLGLVSGPSWWVHLGAAPGKGPAGFWNLLPACPPPQGQRCVTWSYELISQSQPGTFSVDHSGEPGADPEEIQVYDTDYASFALLLSKKQSDLQRILRAEYGLFRPRCWTSSSAWSELRASRMTASSFQT
ncbi:epididymal-specific lipocalin-12 isoform X3 [Bos indicus x Bos taurus]|uniref:epididymal-specific lipocalin-12 isoform X3 n=1 Tax=Bos indicus x Bos taurus TaxID=30522 RepID=UPI000F7D3EBD|nr:epididymal-specific lipocalin-12 isoform X3 [Bos indicus x Bos taurus]